MARYRAGYDLDFGTRGSERGGRTHLDVGSHGYDRGLRRPEYRSEGYRRPWAGGYRDEYQGGSEGIAMRTTGRSVGVRDEMQERGGYGPRYGRDYGRTGGGHPDLSHRIRYGTDYDTRPEDFRPRYSPVGGMAPAMGGEYKYRGDRAWPYDRWFNEWSRRF